MTDDTISAWDSLFGLQQHAAEELDYVAGLFGDLNGVTLVKS